MLPRLTPVLCLALTCSATLAQRGNATTDLAARGLQASAMSVCADARAVRTTLSGGSLNTCALAAASGAVICWGAGDAASPLGTWPHFGQSTVPASLGSGQASVSAGEYHACAVSQGGALQCWGQPSEGRTSPPPAAAAGQAAVSAGGGHTCALSISGDVVCFGDNPWGQTSVPASASTGQVAVAVNWMHSCALSAAGCMTCWGRDWSEYGAPLTTTPPALQTGQVTIAAGAFHNCAVSVAGTLACWGRNDFGQVSVPALAATGQIAVAAGERHTCALSAIGSIACWGMNSEGEASVPLSSQTGQIALTAGDRHTCAIAATAQVTCWGTYTREGYTHDTTAPEPIQTGVALPCLPSIWASQTDTPTRTSTLSSSLTATPMSTLTPGLSCPPSLFRSLPRTDLVGTPLVDAPLATVSEGACRIACCGMPGCDGYAFAFTELRWVSSASCLLYANVSTTEPNSFAASGLWVDVALPSPAASLSPAQTPLPANAWPRRSGSPSPPPSPTLTPAAFVPSDTVIVSSLNIPYGIRIDRQGRLLIANWGASAIVRADAVTGEKHVLVAGPLNHPCLALQDIDDTILIADNHNHCIRRANLTTGELIVVAGTCGVSGPFTPDGGLATSATMIWTPRVAVHRNGDIIISEEGANRIRAVSRQSGILRTIAGGGPLGDGAPATSAALAGPHSVVFLATGDMLIADTYHHKVRRVDAVTGIITSIAGTGMDGWVGDGGPASAAALHLPFDLACDASGNVYIAETSRVRRVDGATAFISTLSAVFNCDGSIALNAAETALFYVTTDSVQMLTLPHPAPTSSPSPSPYCVSSIFRALPRMDLVGTLAGSALAPGAPTLVSSTAACRQACCDAPACDGFSFATGDASFISGGTAGCFLYVNITQLIPSSVVTSGIYESTL